MSKKEDRNVLDYIPVKNPDITWSIDENGVVTLDQENKGVFNRIAQKAFNRPPVSHIELESYGSFIWPRMDGEKTIYDIALELKAEFGDEAEPLYDRIFTYFRMLQDHGFAKLMKN